MSAKSEAESKFAKLTHGFIDPECWVEASSLRYEIGDLAPTERSLAEKAISSRQREFATGRVLAHRLLDQAGHDAPALLRDKDRVPEWPSGIVGSITHCGSLCVVAVGSNETHAGVGIDVEPDEPVTFGVERVVCRPEEGSWLDEASDDEDRARRVRLIFSVKEATYKAFYPELRTFWSFQDVHVSVDESAERFVAHLPDGPDVRAIEGRVLRRCGWILSSVCRRR